MPLINIDVIRGRDDRGVRRPHHRPPPDAENGPGDWSFGGGVAQFLTGDLD